MSRFNLIFLLFLNTELTNSVAKLNCPKQISDNLVLLTDFEDFNQLNLSLCNTTNNATILEIKPSKKIIFKDFNSKGLSIQEINLNLFIILNNFKGIEISTIPLKDIELISQGQTPEYKKLYWNLHMSDFSFYMNDSLIDEKICNFNTFNNNRSNHFFNFVHFILVDSRTTISNKICPYILESASFQLFSINKLSQSFIFQKLFQFHSISKENLFSPPVIIQFQIEVYRYTLDTNLLNVDVFQRLFCLDVNGVINLIQPDLFKSFSNLRVARIRSPNMKRVLANKWFEYLNYDAQGYDLKYILQLDNIKQFFLLVLYQEFSNLTYYDFPNEDICDFRNFPHEKLVMLLLKPVHMSKCSCTELFLIQYSRWFFRNIKIITENLLDDYDMSLNFYHDTIFDSTFSKCINSSFKTSLNKCEFEKRFINCDIISINNSKTTNEFNWYVFDWEFTSKIILSFTIYTNFVFSGLSICTNILTIIVFSDRKMKKDFGKFYVFLIINSYSNVFYNVILVMELLSNCYVEMMYCSQFYSLIFGQYIKILLFKMLKNSLKTFSNLTFMSFILSRFILITNSKNKYLIRFNKITVKLYLIISIPFCLALNAYIYFEYQVILTGKENVFKSDEFNQGIVLDSKDDSFIVNIKETTLLNVFQYIKIFISDILIIFVTILIDATLIVFIKQNNRILSSVISHSQLKKNSQSRIISMIILNVLNFLFFRFPSDLIDFYGLIFTYYKTESTIIYKPDMISYIVCRQFRFCLSLIELFNLLYFTSFLFQFYIFYRFDKNLNLGLKKFISKNFNKNK